MGHPGRDLDCGISYGDGNDPRYVSTGNLFGFTACTTGVPSTQLADSHWPNHQRVRQFRGGHNETWGGALVNIDTNAVDGLTCP